MGSHTNKFIFALFQAFLLINISIRANPHHYVSLGIAHRYSTGDVPAIQAISSAKTMFKVEWFTCINRMLPAPEVFFNIIGMNKLRPSPLSNFLKRETGKLSPLWIEVIDGSVRFGREDFLGHRLCHETKTRFGFFQSLLYCLAFRYLDFKRVRFLLQQSNGAQAFFRVVQRGVALGGYDLRVPLANLGELFPVNFPAKALH